MREVVLCADGESLSHPDLLGLAGENLVGQEWLKPISQAEEARRYLRDEQAVEEVWVASSDEMDPINLAAALKHDTRGRSVFLVATQTTGSLRSRASSAGIDGIIDAKELANRYALRKRRHADAGLVTAAAPGSDAASRSASVQSAQMTARDDAAGARVAPFAQNSGDCRDVSSAGSPDVVPAPPTSGKPRVPGAPMPPAPLPQQQAPPSNGAAAGQRTAHPVSTDRSRNAYVLTVVSAAGGTGKSTVATLSAMIAQSLGCRTLLLDGDLQFGDTAQLLSEKSPLRIDHALRDPSCLDRLSPAAGMPALLAAPLSVEDAEEFAGGLADLVGELRRRFDVIVINTGAFWTEEHIKLLELSSNALFLLDQRPGCLGATKRALNLCARCGVAASPFLYAVNRCSKNGMLTSLDISCALNGAKVVELKDGGREVGELMGAGLAGELMQTRNAFCQSLQAFMSEILPKTLQSTQTAPQESGQPRRITPFHRKRRA